MDFELIRIVLQPSSFSNVYRDLDLPLSADRADATFPDSHSAQDTTVLVGWAGLLCTAREATESGVREGRR